MPRLVRTLGVLLAVVLLAACTNVYALSDRTTFEVRPGKVMVLLDATASPPVGVAPYDKALAKKMPQALSLIHI